MHKDLNKYVEVATEAAQEAAQYIRSEYGRLQRKDIREKSKNDYVTFVDHESEKRIIEILRQHFPAHQIIGEESGFSEQQSDYAWVIDPLDGTKNFIARIPVFAVSIGLVYQGVPVAGCIIDVMLDDLYTAARGLGAFRNGLPIRVADKTDLQDTFFATGFPHRDKQQIPYFTKALEALLKMSSGARRGGAAAIDMCGVAQGTYDYYFEKGIQAWDIAAGMVIVEEAGGRVSSFNNAEKPLFERSVIASNKIIHQQLLDIIPPFYRDLDSSDT
jgi:myo-inositol-1(or 4)-monophosphatase